MWAGGANRVAEIVQHVEACHQVEILGGKILCLRHLETSVAGTATLARKAVACSIDGSWKS